MSKDLRTKAIVLRRTNYGETDRIINFLTPEGKISAIAKGVRKEKSKLAGGIEMFCVSDIVIHRGKSDIGVITSAKMLKYYQNILTSLSNLELSSEILKLVNKSSEHGESEEYFGITYQALDALDRGVNKDIVESWFLFNLARIDGNQVNLLTDANGEKLVQNQKYMWDNTESALRPHDSGSIATDEIKAMRLMLSADLVTVSRVTEISRLASEIIFIAKAINQQ